MISKLYKEGSRQINIDYTESQFKDINSINKSNLSSIKKINKTEVDD